MKSVEEIFREALANCEALSSSRLIKLEPLPGDASNRRYIRGYIDDNHIQSVMLMLLSEDKGPICAGDTSWHPNDSFVELLLYLERNDVRVPRLYLDCRERGYLLVEDVGDLALWKVLSKNTGDYSLDKVQLLEKSVELLHKINHLPSNGCRAFNRWMNKDTLYDELRVYFEHYVPNHYLDDGALRKAQEIASELCANISKHKMFLSHRDYMPWNIHIKEGEIVLIDFQDMLIAPYAFDLVGLLEDRGIYRYISQEQRDSLLSMYSDLSGIAFDKVKHDYHECMLHRGLRVLGVFSRLVKNTGKAFYKDMLPFFEDCVDRSAMRLFGENPFLNVGRHS